MIPMALPSDSMFYNETRDQALLFTVSGMIGLANWFSSPPHPAPHSPFTATLYANNSLTIGICRWRCSSSASGWTCGAKAFIYLIGCRQANALQQQLYFAVLFIVKSIITIA
jgi:hypothetical protein